MLHVVENVLLFINRVREKEASKTNISSGKYLNSKENLLPLHRKKCTLELSRPSCTLKGILWYYKSYTHPDGS